MEIEVRLYAMLREIANKKIDKISLQEKSSIRDLLGVMVSKYGAEFEWYIYDLEKQPRSYLSYMVNGININSLNGFDTVLKDGDVVSILPPVGGG
ncbi:MoaD/ThiS family protein [Candidatus Bathyarchaeota archaeon]|nr:MoaD/ThiS family protein [Candidatus Bathyarchaeota archaeon]